jgi:hypothetical protein
LVEVGIPARPKSTLKPDLSLAGAARRECAVDVQVPDLEFAGVTEDDLGAVWHRVGHQPDPGRPSVTELSPSDDGGGRVGGTRLQVSGLAMFVIHLVTVKGCPDGSTKDRLA